MAAGPGFHSTDVGGYKRISGDCVSWADNLVDEKAMIKSTANVELKIIFKDGCFFIVQWRKGFNKIRDTPLLFQRSSTPSVRCRSAHRVSVAGEFLRAIRGRVSRVEFLSPW